MVFIVEDKRLDGQDEARFAALRSLATLWVCGP